MKIGWEKYFLFILISRWGFYVEAQYQRRHADGIKDVTALLRAYSPESYYFSLLPPHLACDVCKCAQLDIYKELEKALAKKDRELCMFLRSLNPKKFKRDLIREMCWSKNLFAAHIYVSINPDIIDTENPDDRYSYPLHFTAQLGYATMMEFLLSAGANPNQVGVYLENYFTPLKTTPLKIAIDEGEWECARLLLEAGANPDEGMDNKYSSSQLVLVAEKNHLDTVKLLLRKKVKVNARSGIGPNALYYAAKNNNLEMVTLLLEHGIDATYSALVSPDSTPLQEAAIHRNLPMMKLLLAAGAYPEVQLYTKKHRFPNFDFWFREQIERLLAPFKAARDAKYVEEQARIKPEHDSMYLTLLPRRAMLLLRQHIRVKNDSVVRQKKKKQKEIACTLRIDDEFRNNNAKPI